MPIRNSSACSLTSAVVPAISHTSRLRTQFQRAAFDAAARLEQFDQINADGLESALAQLPGQTGRRLREHDVPAIGERVQTEDLGVGRGRPDRVGETGGEYFLALPVECPRVVHDLAGVEP